MEFLAVRPSRRTRARDGHLKPVRHRAHLSEARPRRRPHAPDRRQLTAWLLANTTSTNRFRAGLPEDWALGDKTGTGKYGTTNDAGIAWTPDGAPVVLAVLSTKPDTESDTPMDEPLVAKTAALLAKALV